MKAIVNEIVMSEDIDDRVADLYNNTDLTLKEISKELRIGYGRVLARVSYLMRRGAINGRKGRSMP